MDVAVKCIKPPTIHSSRKFQFQLIFIAAVLLLQACACAGAEANQSGKTAEITETVGNQFDIPPQIALLQPSPFQNQNDIMEIKRHLGAVAALSGSRQFTGSRSFIPPSKKHLGSIAAAQSLGRLAEMKLDLGPPSMQREVLKRHLGALMALSGFKSRPLTRSLKGSLPEYQIDSSVSGDNIMDSQHEEDFLLPYSNEPSLALPSETDYKHINSEVDGGTDFDENVNADDESTSPKPKRFLGSLARGGWFPRHFRGVISENSFGKRHIGSLARLGWMPHAKATSRLGLGMDDPRGDIGLKRNDATRRRMLYHFTAPSLWTSPRGK